jgi:hypothetical protein
LRINSLAANTSAQVSYKHDGRPYDILYEKESTKGVAMSAPVSARKPMLVALDVDGTLLRGETICECLGRGIGKIEEMKTFELLTSQTQIFQARRTMLGWFMPYGRTGLLKCMKCTSQHLI